MIWLFCFISVRQPAFGTSLRRTHDCKIHHTATLTSINESGRMILAEDAGLFRLVVDSNLRDMRSIPAALKNQPHPPRHRARN